MIRCNGDFKHTCEIELANESRTRNIKNLIFFALTIHDLKFVEN